MKMEVDFLKYLVIEVYGNTAKALALSDKRLVKKTEVSSHFASKQETPQGISRPKDYEDTNIYLYGATIFCHEIVSKPIFLTTVFCNT
jgi:hypothetical protein